MVKRDLRSQSFKKVAEIVELAGQVMAGSTFFLFFVEYLQSMGEQFILETIASMRISTHQVLFNQRVPSLVDDYFNQLFSIIAFDFLQMDSLFELFPGFKWDPFLPRFEAMGYESKQMLVNLGSIFALIFPFFIIMLVAKIVFLLNLCQGEGRISKAIHGWFKQKWKAAFWNGMIIYYFDNFLLHAVSAFLSLRFFDMTSSFAAFSCTFYSILVVMILVFIPLRSFYLINKNLLCAQEAIKQENELTL